MLEYNRLRSSCVDLQWSPTIALCGNLPQIDSQKLFDRSRLFILKHVPKLMSEESTREAPPANKNRMHERQTLHVWTEKRELLGSHPKESYSRLFQIDQLPDREHSGILESRIIHPTTNRSASLIDSTPFNGSRIACSVFNLKATDATPADVVNI